jgi:hypothetical protein
MTSWGLMQVGKMALAEVHSVSRQQHETFGTKSITVSGVEYWPGRALSEAEVIAKADDLLWLKDKFLPVTFSNKPNMNGFYVIMDSGETQARWPNEAHFFPWEMQLQAIGPESAIDVESRLTATVRANNFALSGERWHAPPVGHYGYYTGTTPPSGTVVRPSSYGNMTVYRGITAGINPRWGVPVASMANGRVVLAISGLERAGFNIAAPTSAWVLDNGLIRVAPLASSGLLSVGVWNGSGWDNKAWNVARAGSNLTLASFNACTVLRNDFEAVTIRLIADRAPGRNTLDITVRRGSRFLECLLTTDSSATLAATLQTSETQTDVSASGYVWATGNDAFGDKFVAGSSKSFTAIAGGGLQKAAVVVFDFFLGVVYNGTTAIAGDGATDIRDQYIGAMAEATMGVRR